MSSYTQSKGRQKRTKIWYEWFKKKHGREPTREEGLIFGQGFNMGWKYHCKISTIYLYSELSELINNLNDDLELDLKNGEEGYSSYEKSYEAVKMFTLKILNKKLKAAEHNIKSRKFAKSTQEVNEK